MADDSPGGINFRGKLGKLPIWLWGLIFAGVVLIGYYFVKSRQSASTVAQSSTSLDPSGYQTSGMPGSGKAVDYATTQTSNATWLETVSRSVSDALGQSPSQVYAALQKWLTGQDITSTEQTWVDKAIQIGMAPPEGTQGTSTVVTTPTPTDYQKQAATLLDSVFNGFTDAKARAGGDSSSSRQTAINTWAARLQGGMTTSQAINAMESGGTYANLKKQGQV
jgi:hypothetical protein